MPGVGARLEDVGLGQLRVVAALQVVAEEGQLDLLLEELRGRLAERHLAERVARAARPATVGPGTHDQAVRGPGALRLDRPVGLERAEEVLGVEPAAHGEHGGLDALEVRPRVAGLPEGVVALVRHDLLPEGHVALEVLPVEVRHRPGPHEELVAVGGAVVEARRPLRGRLGAGLAEGGVEVEGVRQEEGAVVVEVVADEPVGDRRLGRGGDERRVGVDRGHRGVEARVRDAPDPDLSVVEANALQEPLDRVPGVARLVHVLRSLGGVEGPHVHELALRHEAAPHVLVDEDEPLLRRRVRGAHAVGVGVAPVGRDAVGRAVEQDRIALGATGVLRDVDGGEQLHPVAHRDAVLVLGEARPHGIGGVGGGRGSRAGLRRRPHRRGRREAERGVASILPGFEARRYHRRAGIGAAAPFRACGREVRSAGGGCARRRRRGRRRRPPGSPPALRPGRSGRSSRRPRTPHAGARRPAPSPAPAAACRAPRRSRGSAPGWRPASLACRRSAAPCSCRRRAASSAGRPRTPRRRGPCPSPDRRRGSGSSPRATSSAAGRSARRRRAPASTRRPSGRRSSSSAPGAAPAWPSCPRPRGSPCRGRRSRRRASPGARGPAR